MAWSSTASSTTCCPPASSCASQAAPVRYGVEQAGRRWSRSGGRRAGTPRPTCCTSCRTRSSATRSSRLPGCSTRSRRAGPPIVTPSSPWQARSTNEPTPRCSIAGGSPTPTRSVFCAATTARCAALQRCARSTRSTPVPSPTPSSRRSPTTCEADRWRPVSVRSWCAGCSRARAGELMSRDFAALVIDLKRTYLELRPALARVYVNAVDVAAVAADRGTDGIRARSPAVCRWVRSSSGSGPWSSDRAASTGGWRATSRSRRTSHRHCPPPEPTTRVTRRLLALWGPWGR